MQNRTFALILCLLVVIYPPSIGVTASQDAHKKNVVKFKREPTRTDTLAQLLIKAQQNLSNKEAILKKQQDTIKRLNNE
jgi:hypothetical protein